jgi:hypothetical protein
MIAIEYLLAGARYLNAWVQMGGVATLIAGILAVGLIIDKVRR